MITWQSFGRISVPSSPRATGYPTCIPLSLSRFLYTCSLSLSQFLYSLLSYFLLPSILYSLSRILSRFIYVSFIRVSVDGEHVSRERERESRAGSCISLSRGGSSWLQRRRWSNTARIAVGGGRPTISLSFDSRGNREVTKGGTKGLCGALFIGPRIIGPGRP